ncbi:MAG TPA: hypothetical protein VG675_04920 [Bryobacteraceae bacterium]|nr:hypothetical protein [Bryobacteraceae bacterium]
MPRNFNLPVKVKGVSIRDPRVLMRALLAVLLAANLLAAVIAFKPFGGSAEDLRRQQVELQRRLTQLQARASASRRLADKVALARREGDQFLDKYVTDRRTTFSTVMEELGRTAKDSGIVPGAATYDLQPIEGSNTLSMLTITAAFNGSYASLTKFVNLLDKSPRFLIIENLSASPQQNGQTLNVSLKLDTFVKEMPGGKS